MIAPGRIEIREVPEPTCGPDEVLLQIKRIGVCGSDVHVWGGKHPYTSYPVVQGHEFSAEVVTVGPKAANVRPGDKVTAMPQLVCGQCRPCRRGDYHICDALRVQGFQAPGCAQELFVTKSSMIVPLPETFSFEQGALVEPVAVAVHAVSKAGGVAGKNTVVLGAGPIGNLVAQVACAEGANVLITDLSEYRLRIAGECGIQTVSNARDEELSDAAQRAFGDEGFDVAIECVGVAATIGDAIENVQKGGTIVVVGVFGEKPSVNLGFVQDRELRLHGTLMYQRADYEKAVELIASGAVATEPLLSKHFPMEQYAEAYRYIEEQRDGVMKVVIDV